MFRGWLCLHHVSANRLEAFSMWQMTTPLDPTFVQCLSHVYWPTATFEKTSFFQVQLSGQLEEREMARAMASYVFPMFKAGVGEETPAEIGILRMIWILSMKLGPDMMKIGMWILKHHFCGSFGKNDSKISTKSVHRTSQILKRSFWAQQLRGNTRKSPRGCFGWRGFGSGKILGMVDHPWMISR